MKTTSLAHMAVKHGYNHLAEALYLRSGADLTKPVSFYALINERCNVKCRYCKFWRLPEYKPEMTIEQWQTALLSIRAFVGTYSINFSGGEPFLKPGFLDLMDFCRKNGIHSGVTTNGSTLNRKNAARLVETQPFNLNISCDAPSAELHDYLRGYPSLFERLVNGIRYVRDARDKAGLNFPIVIKTTVNAKNFRLLPEMVKWTQEVGATALNLQPLDRWTQETYDELWIEESDWPELERVQNTLIALKRAGEPIMNSETVINQMVKHFREEKAPPEAMPCRVGMRDFFIRTNGDVQTCFYFPVIGNLTQQSAEQIWRGPAARKIRKETIACQKLCLHTCLSQKTLRDKVKMGLILLRGR